MVPNLLNVDFKNSSVIELLPPTNMVIPFLGGSAAGVGTAVTVAAGGSGELGAGRVVFVVEVVEVTKLLYKFYKHQ